MLHGLSGTPETMRPVVDSLREANFYVNAPLLPGHGTKYQDLSQVKWQDWWKKVLEAYYDVKEKSERVSCVGLSLGSLLALQLAIEMKLDLQAAVVMGTPLVLPPLLEHLAHPLVKYSPVRWLYRYSDKDWKKSVADEEGRDFYQKHSYEKLSVHAVMELFRLKKKIRSRLGEITAPVLAIHGQGDLVAPLKNLDILERSIGSNMFEEMVFGASRHVVSLDHDRNRVAEATVAFLTKFS